jgi:predicted nucleic acid-binding protein
MLLARVLGGLEEVPVDRAIAQAAGRIRRAAQLQVADALIAATAFEHDMPIITRNRRHFERVTGLTLRSPEPTGA